MRKIRCSVLFLFFGISAYAQNDEPIPFATFSEIIINISFPQFQALKANGGFVAVEGGVRGIIVYREEENKFIAYDRACSYKPTESCARVEPDLSRLFLIDRCCGSNFVFSDGYPSKGPASRPLRKYRTQFSGTTLTITDEIIY